MRAPSKYFCLASLLLALAPARAQTDARDPGRPASAIPTSRPTTSRSTAPKGPLPDPVLLDGSNQPAEKKPDYGMLGEFEIPGDENSKSGKVGGQQDPNQKGGGGGQQQQQQNQSQQGGAQGGMPQAGGASGGAQQQANQSAQKGGGGAAGGQQSADQNAQAGGGAAGGQPADPSAQGTSGASAGGDPNAKAEGAQVAGLEGDAQGGAGGAPGDNVPKPQQVAIGDKAMQINPAPNAPGTVGQATVSNSTQQMESKIGKGSGPGPTSGAAGKGVEKGRTMPTGL